MCVTTAATTELGNGFDSELGLTFLEVTPDGGRAQLEINDKLLQPWGIMHGGVYCSIVESLASVSGHVWLPRTAAAPSSASTTTPTSCVPSHRARVTAVSTPIHRGRRQQLWLITITDDNDRLVARGQVRLQNLDAGLAPLIACAADCRWPWQYRALCA